MPPAPEVGLDAHDLDAGTKTVIAAKPTTNNLRTAEDTTRPDPTTPPNNPDLRTQEV